MSVSNKALLYGAILMLLAVAIGAFGAHALAPILVENQRVEVFATASNYHFYHAFGLLISGLIFTIKSTLSWPNLIVSLMFSGTIIFSGSLYCLAIFNVAWLGAITPIGGVMLLASWGLLALSFWNARHAATDNAYNKK